MFTKTCQGYPTGRRLPCKRFAVFKSPNSVAGFLSLSTQHSSASTPLLDLHTHPKLTTVQRKGRRQRLPFHSLLGPFFTMRMARVVVSQQEQQNDVRRE